MDPSIMSGKNLLKQTVTNVNKKNINTGLHAKAVISCRICDEETFCAIDLGFQPFANALEDAIRYDTKTYPLKLHVCTGCSAGQLSYCADSEELYKNYLYISPNSTMTYEHFGKIGKFLNDNGYVNSQTSVLEIGSNIGSFLEYLRPFVRSIVGVDPAINIARLANEKGITTINDFFNSVSAEKILKSDGHKDLIIARHCFAHNEKPGLMLEGVNKILSEDGVFVIENAYFFDTVQQFEMDQIYHEHMYYYNARGISKLVEQYGLALIDVCHSPIHGGTMLYVTKRKTPGNLAHERVSAAFSQEKEMHSEDFYKEFAFRIQKNKSDMRVLVKGLLEQGKTIHAYGASAKSTTLLNYYGLNNDVLPFVVDSTRVKQGKYIPGVNIKVISEEEAFNNPPDYYILTSWNYKDEIIRKVRSAGNNETKFIIPHPDVDVDVIE